MTGTPDKVSIFKDAAGMWRWRRVAPNGRIVADGSEGYNNQSDCEDQARQVNAQPYNLEVDLGSSTESDK